MATSTKERYYVCLCVLAYVCIQLHILELCSSLQLTPMWCLQPVAVMVAMCVYGAVSYSQQACWTVICCHYETMRAGL